MLNVCLLYFLLVFQLVLVVFFWIYLQVCIYICSCGTIRISDRHLPNLISFISKITSILQTKTLKLREVIDLDRITLLIEPGFESKAAHSQEMFLPTPSPHPAPQVCVCANLSLQGS